MDYVSPIDVRVRPHDEPSERPPSIEGKGIWLLDIAKNRSDEFLDSIEELLSARGAGVHRARKPTFSKPAPDEVIEAIAIRGDLAVEALAD